MRWDGPMYCHLLRRRTQHRNNSATARFDERSDLFSLGAILYEALTGHRPERVPRAEIARRLTASRAGLPRSVRETVCSLLAESPDKRPASAEKVLDALEPARVYRTAGEGLVPWADTLPFQEVIELLATLNGTADGSP
jgi:serine/threonine protein kinase